MHDNFPSVGCAVDGTFQLRSWLVEPNLNTISRNGTTVQLEPKVMRVLVCLAEHAGEPVSKEDLLKAVWPDTFVGEGVLTRSIFELRRVFEDEAKEPKVIQTIAKRGYRLVAPVETIKADTDVPGNGSSAAARRQGSIYAKRGLRVGVAIGAATTVALLVFLAFAPTDAWRVLSGRRDLPPIQSIAVLPLQNLSGDAAQDYLASGMTEELITLLAQIQALKVISHTSVRRYRNGDTALPQVARELGVQALVTGSVLRSGDRVRVTAQLMYAPQDKTIWAQSYERQVRDALELQSTLATAIVDEIRVRTTPAEQSQLHSSRSVNLKAHEAYLQGRYHVQLESDAVFKKDGAELAAMEANKAEQYFREANHEDPDYAPPYVGIFELLQASPVPGRDWVPEAKPLLLKALRLDDSSAEAHRALASLLRFDGDWQGAKKEYERAIQLAPSDANVHDEYGSFLAGIEGRPQDAMAEYEVAQSLDPKNDHMAQAFYLMRQFDRAIELYQAQARMKPGDAGVHFSLANLYALTERHAEAISEWQELANMLQYRQSARAMGRAFRSGGYEKALRVLARDLEAASRTSYVPYSVIASIYGYAGDRDQAFAWLEKAFEVRDGIDGLRDPTWDPIRSDPRFADLAHRVGLPQ